MHACYAYKISVLSIHKIKTMAILTGPIQYIGTIDDLTAYRTRNSDKVIVRKKRYFPDKDTFKTAPQYEAMRRNNAEFTACAYGGKILRDALGSLILLADYNVSPAMNKFCKVLQQQDKINAAGKRSIVFSAYKESLTSLVLNKRFVFESIVRQRPAVEINRAQGELHVQMGELIPGFNLQLPWKYAYFRFVLSLGILGDLHDQGNGYDTSYGRKKVMVNNVFSNWMLSTQKMPAQSLIVKLSYPDLLECDDISLMAGMGIQMGVPSFLNDIDPVPYAATATVLGVA